MRKPFIISYCSLVLLTAMWMVLWRLPLQQFQAALFESLWLITVFIMLFVLQPVFIYYILKLVFRKSKQLFFISILTALFTGLGFQRYRVIQIDDLLENEGILTTGIIDDTRNYAKGKMSRESLVRASYLVDDAKYLTPECKDGTKSLELGDTVSVIYASSKPEIARIKSE